MSYFSYIPKTTYNGVSVKNVILKAKIIKDVFDKKMAFYPYVIKQGYRPDMVANEVYNDPYLDWVVYFSNTIVDPYYEWPLEDNDFVKYIEKKYSKNVYELQSDIYHYMYQGLTNESEEDIARKNWYMTVETHTMATTEEKAGWMPMSTYDYEYELNEKKRSIQLLSPIYIQQMKYELAEIFK